jgi:hypothetical protein
MIYSKLCRQRASLPLYADNDDVFARANISFPTGSMLRRTVRAAPPRKRKRETPDDGFPILN